MRGCQLQGTKMWRAAKILSDTDHNGSHSRPVRGKSSSHPERPAATMGIKRPPLSVSGDFHLRFPSAGGFFYGH